MTAWKFLRSGGTGRLSGFAWPLPGGSGPGPWVSATGPLVPSVNGIHACRAVDLPAWIDDELWEIELAGPVVELEDAVVARRGRLARRVPGWDRQAALDLVRACLERARARGAAASLAADAAALAQGRRPEGSEADVRQHPAATAANVAFVVAHAAGIDARRGGDLYEAGFAAERTWQAAWLGKRLGLSGAASASRRSRAAV
jgi:hypothetical protein